MSSYYSESWSLGNVSLNGRLIVAPLAGVSAMPFRDLVWRFGGVAYACTEMLAGGSVVSGGYQKPRYFTRSPVEKILCYQFAAGTPAMAEIVVRRLLAQGADIIELNCGCPVAKIRSKGQGSKLLERPAVLQNIIAVMRQNSGFRPIGIKIRLQSDGEENRNILRIAEDAGVDYIVVHGRTWRDDYHVKCDYAAINDLVNWANVPIVGNGDICSFSSLEEMRKTGCAGFMVGRHVVGRPWLLAELQAQASGVSFVIPDRRQRFALLLEHVGNLIELEGEKNAVLQGRMLAKYYARDLGCEVELLKMLCGAHSYAEYSNLIASFC